MVKKLIISACALFMACNLYAWTTESGGSSSGWAGEAFSKVGWYFIDIDTTTLELNDLIYYNGNGSFVRLSSGTAAQYLAGDLTWKSTSTLGGSSTAGALDPDVPYTWNSTQNFGADGSSTTVTGELFCSSITVNNQTYWNNSNTGVLISTDGISLRAATDGPLSYGGTTWCGITYRVTGEEFAPSALTMRSKGYAFEMDDAKWAITISSDARMGVGLWPEDSKFPRGRLHVGDLHDNTDIFSCGTDRASNLVLEALSLNSEVKNPIAFTTYDAGDSPYAYIYGNMESYKDKGGIGIAVSASQNPSALYVHSTGNVGISTGIPQTTLDVNGGFYASTATIPELTASTLTIVNQIVFPDNTVIKSSSTLGGSSDLSNYAALDSSPTWTGIHLHSGQARWSNSITDVLISTDGISLHAATDGPLSYGGTTWCGITYRVTGEEPFSPTALVMRARGYAFELDDATWAITISSTARVGVGQHSTASKYPLGKLHVADLHDNTDIFRSTESYAINLFLEGMSDNNNVKIPVAFGSYIDTPYAYLYGNIEDMSNNKGGIGIAVTACKNPVSIYVNYTGNVGISTGTPQTTLDVNGGFYASTATIPSLTGSSITLSGLFTPQKIASGYTISTTSDVIVAGITFPDGSRQYSAGVGSGEMARATYDADENSVVDEAESLSTGDYLNDIKVSSAIYSDSAGSALTAGTCSDAYIVWLSTITSGTGGIAATNLLISTIGASSVGPEQVQATETYDIIVGTAVRSYQANNSDMLDGLDSSSFLTAHYTTGTITAVFGSSVTVAGNLANLEVYARVPCDMTIRGWYCKADQSGNAVIGVSTGTISATTWTAIDGSEIPTISGASNASDDDLTTWTTTSLFRGDWIRFAVTSADTIKQISVCLEVWKQP